MFCGDGEVEFAGIGFGISDELGKRLHRQLAPDRNHLRACADIGKRHELLAWIEAQLLHLRRQHHRRRRRKHQGVTVGRGRHDLPHSDRAAGARPVLDHETLSELRGEVLRAEPRHHVGVAAGAERHDDGDRPARPLIGPGKTRTSPEHHECGQEQSQATNRAHVIPRFLGGCPCGRALSRSPIPPRLAAVQQATPAPDATLPGVNRLIRKEVLKHSSGRPGESLYCLFSGWLKRLVASLPLNSQNLICRPVVLAGRRAFWNRLR